MVLVVLEERRIQVFEELIFKKKEDPLNWGVLSKFLVELGCSRVVSFFLLPLSLAMILELVGVLQ